MKFKAMFERYNRYMTYVGRKRACEVLLQNSDRMLEDAGFSRELLEKGVAGWPWLTEDCADGYTLANGSKTTASHNVSSVDATANVETVGVKTSSLRTANATASGNRQNEDRKVA